MNGVLTGLSSDFEAAYLHTDRLSIPPKKLLQAFCPVRSECQIMEQTDFNILFCWLAGLDMDYRVRSAGTYCHNRDAVAIACAVISMVKNLDSCIVAEGARPKTKSGFCIFWTTRLAKAICSASK